jgi:aarF domain-containing kinase
VIDGEEFAREMQQHLVLMVKIADSRAREHELWRYILSEVLQMVRQHHVRMEGDFVNVVISMLLLEGIRRALDPKMDLLKRYLKRLLRYSA